MSILSKSIFFMATLFMGMLYYLALVEKEAYQELHCGERPERLEEPLQTRMVGGENVSVGIWPWHVSILHQPNLSAPFSQRCAGSIIHKVWVLTSAACASEEEQSKLLIRAGSQTLDVDDASMQQSEVDKIVRHKKFNPVTMRYNIALLKMKTPFVLNDFVHPICVPDKAAGEHTFKSCHITGYNGLPGDNFGVLQEARVFGIARTLCNKPAYWNYTVAADMVCAGGFGGGFAGCETNLGGPLNCYIAIEQRYFMIGIRVKTTSCGKHKRPNVYLKVSTHYWWIHHHIMDGLH